MIIFKRNYFLLTVLLFVIEVLIALFIKDRFLRPYGGDLLVVILIYCFFRSFFRVRILPCAFGVLLFAFTVEFLQYLHFVEVVGLQDNKLAKIIIGTDFAWHDMLAYMGGIVIVLASEYIFNRRFLTAPVK